MGTADGHDLIERFFKAADARDWARMRECYAPDAVEEWPQSGERLVGVDNIMAVNENYPGHPRITVTNIQGAGDLVVGEAELDYDGTKYHLVSLFELQDGSIRREVDYFSAPFEAEEWRAEWVERM